MTDIAAVRRYYLILSGGIFITKADGSTVYISKKELEE